MTIKLYFIIIFIILFKYLFAQSSEPPYPIVFVHGLNSNAEFWYDDNGIIDFLTTNFGWSYKELHITLDANLNYTQPYDSKEDDVILFSNVTPNQIYVINYDVDFEAQRIGIADNNIIYLQDNLFTGIYTFEVNTFVGNIDSYLKIGDIIRIDDEFMKIDDLTKFANDFQADLIVTRGLYNSTINFHDFGSKIWIISNQSNQSSIMKQAYGLYLAIEEIKIANNVDKVILIGHSMGGLAARTYAQFFSNQSIAKIVTIGTPNLGGIKEDIYYDNAISILSSIDSRSEAARDLAYWYYSNSSNEPEFPGIPDLIYDQGIFLNGGEETNIPDSYINKDVNADGDEIDHIVGLNKEALPNNFEYYFYVAQARESTDEWGDNNENDGVVLTTRQWLNLDSPQFSPAGSFIWDISNPAIYAWHTKKQAELSVDPNTWEVKEIDQIIKGLDEPDIKDIGYELEFGSNYLGHITSQGDGNVNDVDYFKIINPLGDILKFTIDGFASGITSIEIYDNGDNLLYGSGISSVPYIFNIPLLQSYEFLFIKVIGISDENTWQNPYSIKVEQLYNSELIPDFGAIPISGNIPLTVQFTDQSTADNTTISDWQWDFENDGSIDRIEQNPLKIYNTAGTYTVSLTVSDGTLSNTETKLNYITVLPEIIPHTSNVEYFFDRDPGFGNGTPITITPGEDVTVQTNLDVSALSTGLHRLYIRAKDDDGQWGMPQSKTVFIQPADADDPSADVSDVEYFFDSDPGQGAGTSLSITPGADINISDNINLTSMNVGLHRLYIRAKDDNGNWGLPQARSIFVQKTSPNAPLTNITEIEYFYDSDPGIGNGTALQITPSADVEVVDELATDMLSLAEHTVFIRAKDASLKWGIPQAHIFTVGELQIFADTVSASIGQPLVFNDQNATTGDGHAMQLTFSNMAGTGNVYVEQTNQTPANLGGPAVVDVVWDITKDITITNFAADATFYYVDTDLIGLNENALIPVYYDVTSNRWKRLLNYTLDATNNTLTINNLDHFTEFAIGQSEAFNLILSNINTFLEGTYSSGSMSTALNTNNLIPLSQPYNVSPWNYNGSETVASVPAGVVDWVLVELRTTTASTSMVSQRAAFLMSDGSIKDTDGISAVSFDDVNSGDYYIVIQHRNHLGVLSASAHSLGTTSTLYDFINGSIGEQFFGGSSGAVELTPGIWGMISGDGNHDGGVLGEDYTLYQLNQGFEGYHDADFNMDGGVLGEDYTIYQLNQGLETTVPAEQSQAKTRADEDKDQTKKKNKTN